MIVRIALFIDQLITKGVPEPYIVSACGYARHAPKEETGYTHVLTFWGSGSAKRVLPRGGSRRAGSLVNSSGCAPGGERDRVKQEDKPW